MAEDPLRQLRLEIGRSRRLIDRRFRDATDGVRLILTLRKQWQAASWSRLWTSFALGLFSAADVQKYRLIQLLRHKLEQWPSQGIWNALWKEVAEPGPVLDPPEEQTPCAVEAERSTATPRSAAQTILANDTERSTEPVSEKSKESR